MGLYAAAAYGFLAGGRPNSFSDGNNAFAGVVNPANAVWIKDRLDIGGFWIVQKSSLDNQDDNPLFPLGQTDLTYKSKNILSVDFAVHKQLEICVQNCPVETSFSLAVYTTPTTRKSGTEEPIAFVGTTPIKIRDKTNVVSAVFSCKLGSSASFGGSLDYFYLSHLRNGFQNSDTPARSVSPGNVTNRGTDHSQGVGCTLGFRWNVTDHLKFGAAWAKKTYCGHFGKYRGFEPQYAKNSIPQTAGGGFTYGFTSNVAGKLEVLWSNLGDIPEANNGVLPNGSLNLNKHGSDNSPGPGLQNATYINCGIGAKLDSHLAVGAGFSKRFKYPKSDNLLSHSYVLQTIYNILSLGANFRYEKHDLFLVFSYGFKNKASGLMPAEFGGGKFTGERQSTSCSLSWGYMY